MIEPRRPDQTERFFGAGLVAVGALVFGLCGLCTLGFAGASLITSFAYLSPSMLWNVVLSVMVGGLPTYGGFLLMRFGWRMYRGIPSRSSHEAKTPDD